MTGTTWAVWVAIALGSAAGGALRHGATEAVTRLSGGGFPWGTVLVNLSGSAVMGAVAAAVAGGWPDAWSPVARHAVMTGVLGGFTTFSTFSMQTVALLQQGEWLLAVANVVASVGLGVAGCWAGFSALQALGR